MYSETHYTQNETIVTLLDAQPTPEGKAGRIVAPPLRCWLIFEYCAIGQDRALLKKKKRGKMLRIIRIKGFPGEWKV